MLEVCDLTCEYAERPLGIQTLRPRLGWRLRSDERGQRQAAYRLRVATSPERLAAGDADLWDSGRVVSDQVVHVEYAGALLQSTQRAWWSVEVEDATGQGVPSATTWFETGLLTEEDWKGAQWIGVVPMWTGRAVLLRHEFDCAKPVVRARLYVAGLGCHEVHVNGVRIGDRVLDPPPTDYERRVLYTTHDLTSHLGVGRNVLGLAVGHGWYGVPKVRLRMLVEFADGTRYDFAPRNRQAEFFARPGGWMADGIYDGEVFDARRHQANWASNAIQVDWAHQDYPTGEGWEMWASARRVSGPGGQMAAHIAEPLRVTRELRPASVRAIRPDVSVLDFGENIAGFVRLQVQAPAGTAITLRFAEVLREDGTVNQDNLYRAAHRDVYICKGGGVETYAPSFTFHGFRYVQVEGWPAAARPEDFTACVVRSDVPRRGEFSCSDELLNRIQRAIVLSEEGNLHGVLTDCPNRTERMGWLNDPTARLEEAIHNFDLVRLLEKWMADIADCQDPQTGSITDTAPYHWGHRPADPVCIAPAYVPWLLWRHWGDRRMVEQYYPTAQKWQAYLGTRAKDNIVEYSHWGDWCPPIKFGGDAGGAVSRDTPGPLVSTGCWLYVTRLLGSMADLLGRPDEAEAYRRQDRQISAAIHRRYFDPATGGYGSNNQACNALVLWLGIVPTEHRQRVLENLVHDVMELHGGHLTTGNICTKYLLEALSTHGRLDVATHIATRRDYPGWGYMVENGATTLWERWEHAVGGGMNSHNHPMLGSVGSWFYRHLAGIQDDESALPGSRFILQPGLTSGLTSARASLHTLHGWLRIAWERNGSVVQVAIDVPANTTGLLRLPPQTVSVVEGGQAIWDGRVGRGTPSTSSAAMQAQSLEIQLPPGVFSLQADLRR